MSTRNIRKTRDTKKPRAATRSKAPTKTEVEKFENDLDDFLRASGVEVQRLDEHEQVPFWINSGSYAFNWVISDDMFKGIPATKVLMLSGEEAKGKSLIIDAWLGENIRGGGTSYKVDIEDAVGKDFTSKIVGDPAIAAKIRIISPSTLKAVAKAKGDVSKLRPKDTVITIEKLTSFINKLIDWQLSRGEKKLPSIIMGIDSVSNLSSDKEVQDIHDSKDKRDMTPQQKMRAFFRAVGQKLKEANITIIGIAHLTANIGVMFGDKKVISAKGTGFKYASSLIVNCVSSKEIKTKKDGTAIGVKMKLKTTKNRVAYKGRETFLYMYFNYGIDPYGGLGELLVQYGLAKASVTKALDGGYPQNTVFSYKDIKWKSRELWDIMQKKTDEERKAILTEWNEELTKAYNASLNFRDGTVDFAGEDEAESEDDE